MRVAFVGKGGAGKSAVAGTFARLLARRGEEVLALDSDPMPGLAYSLGLPTTEAPIPDDAVVEKPEGEEGPRFGLRPDLTPEAAVEQYAVVAPDGVRFLQFGKLRGHVSTIVRSQFAFRAIILGLPPERWSLVGDLPGGTRQPAFGWGGYASTFLLVVEPTPKSVLAARRILRALGGESSDRDGRQVLVVANKVVESADAGFVGARLGLEVIGAIPLDPALIDAERDGVSLLDTAPGSPAVQAVGLLVDRVQERLGQ